MHDTNYKVKRDKIYVGSLTKVHKDIFTIYNESKCIMFDSLSDNKKELMMKCYGHLYTHKPSISLTSRTSYYRTMLFILDENNRANDLLFNCTNYPVMNISKNEDCINSPFVIDRCFNFGEILKYYNYSDLLQFEDVEKVKNMFFKDGDYLLDHCEMFGIVEDDGTGMECIDSKGRHRSFNENLEQHLEILKYQMKMDGNYDEQKLPKYNVVFDECYFIAFWLSGRFPLIPDKSIESNVKVLKLEK